MPILGDLTDFPLPEVLLLVGSRTGCLRLYDVPETDDMELDLAEGHAHALRLGGSSLTEDREIVTQLSVIVGAGAGMFEFRRQPDISVRREQPLPINNLVILMVLYVDEVLVRQSSPQSGEPVYVAFSPLPEIWIDPNLNMFFEQCRNLLAEGARSIDIAQFLGMPNDEVRLNLAYLRQLGFVQLKDEAEPTREVRIEREVAQKSNELQLAAEASDLIRRTGKLLKIPLRQATDSRAA
jgi:hypothetical protein